jgi:hypothetical protein
MYCGLLLAILPNIAWQPACMHFTPFLFHRLAYDGKGNYVVRTEADLDKAAQVSS